jgi:hypothetical protein
MNIAQNLSLEEAANLLLRYPPLRDSGAKPILAFLRKNGTSIPEC